MRLRSANPPHAQIASEVKPLQPRLARVDGLLHARGRGAAGHVAQRHAGVHGAGFKDVLLKQGRKGLELLEGQIENGPCSP